MLFINILIFTFFTYFLFFTNKYNKVLKYFVFIKKFSTFEILWEN